MQFREIEKHSKLVKESKIVSGNIAKQLKCIALPI